MTIPILAPNIIDDIRKLGKRLEIVERTLATPNYVFAHVNKSSLQTVNNASTTGINFDTVVEDSWDMFTASSDRLTVPTDGVYLFTCSVTWAANATGQRRLNLRKNSTTSTIVSGDFYPVAGVDTDTFVSAMFKMSEGDYVDAQVRQTSGGTLDVIVTNVPPFFQAVRL